MKKFKLCFLILLVFLLQGCGLNDPKYINLKTKDGNDFYTKDVYSKLLKDDDFTLEIFDTNVYKNIPIDENEKMIIENFIRSLTKEDYKDEESPSDKEPFQIKISFSDDKYVFKVFDDKRVTIAPWDGVFSEDIVNMENVPKRYNLYDFCTHIQHEAKLNQ